MNTEQPIRPTKTNRIWQVWIDTGGTFTDCLALDPDGNLHREKVLSSSALRGTVLKQIDKKTIQIQEKWGIPSGFIDGFRFQLLNLDHEVTFVDHFDQAKSAIELSAPLQQAIRPGKAFEVESAEEAPILTARLATQTSAGHSMPQLSMRLATTRGTNALLERRGTPIAFFITKGFCDLLRIGSQQRQELFALNIIKPEPLYRYVIEVPERLAADGSVLQPLKPEQLAVKIKRLQRAGISAAAIALIHSYKNPDHEQQLAEFLKQSGFRYISCSSQLAPFIKLLPRAETAVVDAYLAPIISEYLNRVYEPIAGGKLHVMTSAGGLVQKTSYHPKDSLLSGPAGGVVGAAYVGKRSGFKKVIAFDMGGTSTDVARFDGDYEYLFEHRVGDANLVAPALAIESVAAGGGSICRFDGTKLSVGPESAGAQPGPACYGAGGPLTLTDINLLLGRLDSSRFEIPINIQRSHQQIELLQKSIEQKTATKIERESILEGFLDIANERMADAIRRISLRKGYNPGEYALVAFGGAGAQHACGVAERLGIHTILVPQDAGLLSALGIGHAVLERFAERQILKPLQQVEKKMSVWFGELSQQAIEAVQQEGVKKKDIHIRRQIANLRFIGQDSVLPIEYDPASSLRSLFQSRYITMFGHWAKGRPIEVESIRVIASTKSEDIEFEKKKIEAIAVQSIHKSRSYFKGGWLSVPVFERERLIVGAFIKGPALVFEQHSATIIEPGWQAHVNNQQTLILQQTKNQEDLLEKSRPEVVRLELFTNRFRAIAREMGEMLRRTALSTNVKERLDFSCALLDPDGELVVNAPHIPVHLGAMGICVRRLRQEISMEPGDVVVTNHPGFGGSHLPDVTVVTPIYSDDQQLLGYAANRAHHAEIGGIRPGSLSPTAKNLAEEGVLIAPTYLVRAGEANWEDIKKILTNAMYPSRSISENLADLNAAIAANHRGATSLQHLASLYGEDTILRYMEALKQRAELKVREALKNIPNGRYEAIEYLDDASPLKVKIEVLDESAVIDFNGSAEVHPGNLNATPAIVNSVVIYVLRLLVNEPLPLNEGLMRAIKLIIPQGILNPPFPADPRKAPAIVGGNVETSQRLVDTMLKALKIAACSQGTMNNISFGTGLYSYYETVCGGCGAGADYQGASAVHSHMTNTRITDPEIIEHRFPVRVNEFSIRKNSGGNGANKGGDGTVREIQFWDKMSLSVLTQHRKEVPYGLNGGNPGKPGEQEIVRANKKRIRLKSIDQCEVEPGDRLILKTPGGGGYGKMDE